jgi:ketosteroid isomerase-like protein
MVTITSDTERAQDEAAIRERIGKIVEGIGAKDIEALSAVYAKDVVSFDVEPPLQHVGNAAKMRNWVRAFTVFDTIEYELRDLAVTVGGDVAFGHGFGRISGTLANGQTTSGMWVRATFCFQYLGGEWLIVHDQASVPFDVLSGTSVVDLEH